MNVKMQLNLPHSVTGKQRKRTTFRRRSLQKIRSMSRVDEAVQRKVSSLYGTEACPVNSAMRHSLQFALNRALFKISGPFSKDTYIDICNYFGIWPMEQQISDRQNKFHLNYCASDIALYAAQSPNLGSH